MKQVLSTSASNTQNKAKDLLQNFVKKRGSIVIFLFLWILAAIFVKNFASLKNMTIIIKQAAIPIIACLGMTMVLITGGIDLSLGYVVGLSSIIIGISIKVLGLPVLPAVILTLLVGAFVGVCNGLIIKIINVPAFIATLGTGYIVFGVAQILCGGVAYNQLPAELTAIGKTEIFGLPSYVYISLIIIIGCYILLHKTVYGRKLSALGYNSGASDLSGIKTKKLTILTYMICSILTAIAGILLTIRVNCAQSDMGGGNFTFEMVTGAIVGGASLFGGVGTVVGSVFGVLIVKMIENSINLMGASYHLYQAFMGIVILIAIVFENVKNRKL